VCAVETDPFYAIPAKMYNPNQNHEEHLPIQIEGNSTACILTNVMKCSISKWTKGKWQLNEICNSGLGK
jgi:hypothetical protein